MTTDQEKKWMAEFEKHENEMFAKNAYLTACKKRQEDEDKLVEEWTELHLENLKEIQQLRAEKQELLGLVESKICVCTKCFMAFENKDCQIEKRDKLLEQAKPWVDSYHRSRHHTDFNSGQNYQREDWLKEVGELR